MKKIKIVLTIVIGICVLVEVVWIHPHHVHFWWHKLLGFQALFGLAVGFGLVGLAKGLAVLGLQRKSD